MSSRFKRAFFGLSTDLLGTICLILAQFVVTPLFIDMTSPSLYGAWLVMLSTLAYFGLADFGIGMALTRSIAACGGKDRAIIINGLISSAFFFFLAAGLFIGSVGWVCSYYITGWIALPETEQANIILTFRIAVIGAAISLPLNVFSSMLVGMQRMALANTIRTVIALLSITITVMLLYLNYGLASLACGTLFQFVVGGLSNAYYVYKYNPSMKIRISLVTRHDMRSLYTYGGYFQLGVFANTVVTNTDSILIGLLLGVPFVSQYMLSLKLVALIGITLASKMAVAAFPAVSKMFVSNNMEQLRKVFMILSHYGLRLGIVASLWILMVNDTFVSLWVGRDLYGGMNLTIVFASWLLIDSLNRSVCVIVQASGDVKEWAIASVIEGVANVLLSYFLIFRFGLIGAALGTLVARGGITIFIYQWLFKRLDIDWKKMFLKNTFFSAIKSLLGSLIVLIVFSLFVHINGWLSIISLILLMAIMDIMLYEGIPLWQKIFKGNKVNMFEVMKLSWRSNCGW